MKKVVSAVLAIIMIISCLSLAGCAKKNSDGYNIVMITDGGTISDGAYNQSTWKGIEEYSEENNMTCRYYQPPADENGALSVETIKNYVELAAKDKAKFVVLPGEAFAVGAYEVAPAYKDINFILVDALPHAENDSTVRFQSNVMCVSFNALEAGFLAGYSSVAAGFTKLGYIGSVNSKNSGDYGAGFVQGASFAANSKEKAVSVDYANIDDENLAFNYDFTFKATYKKVSDEKEKTFKVKVVDGIGSGVYANGENVTITANPAPEGKIFDHWEVKSNTDGVRDRKVNISSKTKPSMNLLVGKCDCTITAVWADAETGAIEVVQPDYSMDYYESLAVSRADVKTYYAPIDSEYTVEAPVAPNGYVFDKWSCSEDEYDDIEEKSINIKVKKSTVQLMPLYKKSDVPTFNVTVENGNGSGSYVSGDKVKLVADEPKDGYMFNKWEIVDENKPKTGISMENEYCYHTEFEMINRFASLAETMFDGKTEMVFGGGNPLSDSIFDATNAFEEQVWAFGSGSDEGSKSNCFASIVNDYGAAVKLCLKDYQPGGILNARCENGCLYVSGKIFDDALTDDKGKETNNTKQNKSEYDMIYQALSEGKIALINMQSGGDVRKTFKSDFLKLNYWINE